MRGGVYKIDAAPKREGHTGISLPELLVAMILVGLLLTATFYVFSAFFSKSLAQQRESLTQADAQVGAQFIKWDIFMAGYGMPSSVIPISNQDNAGENGSDILTLQSVAFGPSGRAGKWTYMLSPANGTNQILVRRWNDPQQDITKGDYIIILSPAKGQVGLPVYQVTDTATAVGPTGQDAWLLTLNNIVNSSLNFVFSVGSATGPQSVTYYVQNGNLMRDSTIFMPNVVNFQVRFWVDLDGDKQVDAGEEMDDLSAVTYNPSLLDNIRLMRISIVSATRQPEGYYYPRDTIVVANQIINTDNYGRNLRYDLWQTIIRPRNL